MHLTNQILACTCRHCFTIYKLILIIPNAIWYPGRYMCILVLFIQMRNGRLFVLTISYWHVETLYIYIIYIHISFSNISMKFSNTSANYNRKLILLCPLEWPLQSPLSSPLHLPLLFHLVQLLNSLASNNHLSHNHPPLVIPR